MTTNEPDFLADAEALMESHYAAQEIFKIQAALEDQLQGIDARDSPILNRLCELTGLHRENIDTNNFSSAAELAAWLKKYYDLRRAGLFPPADHDDGKQS
jgi:hypothetical protein